MAFKSAKLTAVVAFASLSQTFLSSTGAAQTARVELHPIKTTTLTDQQFLSGAKSGPEVIIGGEFGRLLSTPQQPCCYTAQWDRGLCERLGTCVELLGTQHCRQLCGTSITMWAMISQLGRLVQVFDSYAP
jgi:hypothetical protein